MTVPIRRMADLTGDTYVAVGPVGRWAVRQNWVVVVNGGRVCGIFPTIAEAHGYISGCFEPEEHRDELLIVTSTLPNDAPPGQASKRDPLGDVFFLPPK